MSVVSVNQVPNEQEQSVQTNTERNDIYTYLVECSSPTDTADVALNAAGLPQMAATITGHNGTNTTSLVVLDRDVRRHNRSPYHFIVRVTAGTPTLSGTNKTVVDIAVDGVRVLEPIYEDAQVPGRMIQNAAADFFEPPLQRSYTDEVISVHFTSNAVDLTNIEACRENVNSGSITMNVITNGLPYTRTFAAKTLLLDNARYAIRLGDGAAMWKIEYAFLYRADGWQSKLANMGFYCLPGGGTVRVRCMDDRHQDSQVAMPLATNGAQLPAGTAPNFLAYNTKGTADFGGLFLGLV